MIIAYFDGGGSSQGISLDVDAAPRQIKLLPFEPPYYAQSLGRATRRNHIKVNELRARLSLRMINASHDEQCRLAYLYIRAGNLLTSARPQLP